MTAGPTLSQPSAASEIEYAADPAETPPGRRWGSLRLRKERARTPDPDRTPRRWLLLPSLLLLAATLAQRPGKIVADTKVALVLDPAHFLSTILHLWNPLQDTGSIGDQSTGYLMPMGPFFLLTHGIRIPAAVAERLWTALILVTAFWGLVRVADALGLGNRIGRVLAGLAYAASPFVLSRIGDSSALLLGHLLLPWVLLPLIRATYRRGERELLSARRAAALSGCAVLLTGGVNASVTLDMLIMPALWLLLMCRGRSAWILRGWWVLAVFCATAWWMLSLQFLGRYGLNFVKYTETATTTTSVTSLPETIRGTADWLGYLRFGGAGFPSSWTYISAPAAIVASFLLAGVGLAGLARTHVPARRFLVASLAIGVLAVAAAYAGNPHGVLAGPWLKALSGPLAALRNINKFQPLIRLPIALGLAHCAPLLFMGAKVRARRWRRALNIVTVAVLAGAVVVGAAPLGLSRLYKNGSFTSVPTYWKQAAAYLQKSANGTRTLLVPGSGFGAYSWGIPADEPMLWLARSPWAVRNIIPLGGVNSTRWLDGIEQQLGQRSTPELAAVLGRAGYGFVLVRNDLQRSVNDSPPSTDEVHTAMAHSGLKRVAAFGPMVSGRPSGIQSFLHTPPTPGKYPAIEIYEQPNPTRADAYPASALAVLSGGPEIMPYLPSTGVLENRPTVLAADLAAGDKGYAQLPNGVKPTAWIDTDSLTRRDEQYGSLHNGTSYVLPVGEKAAGESTKPQVRLDVSADGHQTTSLLDGIASITASHYAFVLAAVPAASPQSAIDSDPATSWSVAGFPHNNVGQWLQVTLDKPLSLPSIRVSIDADTAKRLRITALRVTTDTGSRVVKLVNTEQLQPLALPAGPTKSIRLTIAGVAKTKKSSPFYGPGIREIAIPGVTITRTIALPNDAAAYFPAGGAQSLSYVFNRDRSDPQSFINLDVERQIGRTFTVPRTADFYASATVVDRSTQLPAKTGATVSFACGTGPDVEIDGKKYATYAVGSRSALLAGQPIPLGLCLNRPITLAAGRHTLRTLPSASPLYQSSLGVATLSLTSVGAPKPAANRSIRITKWGDEKRTVDVAAGEASILTVHENFNKAWQAKANGKQLTAIRVDGWQQGFVLPAGAATTVTLTNGPGQAYRLGLLLAGLLVLGLLVLAAWPARRPARPIKSPRARSALVVRTVALAAAIGTTLLVAGPLVAAAVPLLALVVWFLRRSGPLLVLAGITVAAGMTLAYRASYPSSHHGAFSSLAQVAVALAVAAVILGTGERTEAVASPGPEAAEPAVSDEQVRVSEPA